MTIKEALSEFIDDIESTGGLVRQPNGFFAPAADPEWTGLGRTYLEACAAIGKEPMLQDKNPEGNEDDPGTE